MWKYIGDGSTLIGAPPRDMSDKEFAEVSAKVDEREGTEGALEACGLYEHEPDKQGSTAKAGKRGGN